MFATDSRTESFLTWMGVKWEYTNNVSFSQLEESWDSHNSGRSQVKVEGAIREYGVLMDRGSAAPAPILWQKKGTSKYQVMDGIQRLLAEEPRKPSAFSAYLLKTDSESTIQKVRVFSNYRLQGGYQESSEWTLEHAVELLIVNGNMSVEEVSEMGGWSRASVRDKRNIVDYRLAVRGVGGPERLPDSVLRLFASHASRDDFATAPMAIAGMTNDLHRMRMSADECAPYIEEFFSVARSKGKLFDQFNEKLKEFRDDEEVEWRLSDPTRRRYQAMTPEGKVLKALKTTLTVASNVLAKQDPIDGMEEYYHLLNKIRTVLQQIERMSKLTKKVR